MAGKFKAPRGLNELEHRLRHVKDLLPLVAAAVSEEFIALIREGFDSQTDPYGRKWRPKKVPDGRKTLSGPTGRLKNLWHVTHVGSDGFEVASGVNYAAHHQHGAPRRNLPKRRMVPTESQGMPKKWREAVEEAATEALTAHFQGQVPTRPRKVRQKEALAEVAAAIEGAGAAVADEVTGGAGAEPAAGPEAPEAGPVVGKPKRPRATKKRVAAVPKKTAKKTVKKAATKKRATKKATKKRTATKRSSRATKSRSRVTKSTSLLGTARTGGGGGGGGGRRGRGLSLDLGLSTVPGVSVPRLQLKRRLKSALRRKNDDDE